MTTFDYTKYDRTHPGGSNGLSAFAMYYQRLLYKEAIYPPNLFSPLDTWYDKLYYGRVDQTQNTVIADITKLKTIPAAASSNLFALDFVVDAFQDFVDHMRNSIIMGVIRKSYFNPDNIEVPSNPKLYDPKAYAAYQDPTQLYNDYLQQILNQFKATLLPEQSNKITNLKDFTAAYASRLYNTSKLIPVTKTNYLLTNIFNVLNSGLSIALERHEAANDDYKYERWINDPNFNYYVRVAKKFGFIVNKNAPWILTADLFSPAILKYIESYTNDAGETITKDNFFDSYYQRTYLTDIDQLRTFILNSYKDLVQFRPVYEVRKRRPNCGKDQIEMQYRQSAAAAELVKDAVLTDKYMADMYLTLRHNESERQKEPSKKLRVEMSNIYGIQPNKSITPLQNVSAYINLIYRDFIYSVDYLFLNDILLQETLDNRAIRGKITTTGAIAKNIY